jgi:hypothetical protein
MSVPQVVHDVGYLLLQGSSQLKSQGDLAGLLEFLWLLYHNQVPATNVRAFLSPVLGEECWPSSHVGRPPLTPPPFEPSIIITERDLSMCVHDALTEFCCNPNLRSIVVVYSDHGNHTDEELITAKDCAVWGIVTQTMSKPLLVVLDTPDSDSFATTVWATLLKETRAAKKDRHRKFLGFLTAGNGSCCSSPIVSRDPGCVHLFDEAKLPASGDWAMGMTVTNSMFLRQFLWVLAYGAWNRKTITLTELPDVLNANGKGQVSHGFQARFVGEGHEFGDMPVSAFFPLAQVEPDTPIRGWDAVNFDAVIPSAPIGTLMDDLTRFWNETEDQNKFQFRYVEVAFVNDVLTEVSTGLLQD